MDSIVEPAKKPRVVVNDAWCKGCGICVLLCPREVLQLKLGKAYVDNAVACNGCKICEWHCPDYAITVGGNIVD